MKNEQLIKKILNKINNKNARLKKSMFLCGDRKIREYYEVIKDKNEWVLASREWLIPLKELTNRELIKLYQSL